MNYYTSLCFKMLDTDERQIPLEFLKVGMLKCSCISLEYSL